MAAVLSVGVLFWITKMQFQIIPRQLDGSTVQTVNARELHSFLEVRTAFKDWIDRRISEYGFEEGVDFCSFLSESTGGRPSKEYAVTIETAKELAMVERNEKGREARKYFIECERRFKEQTPVLPSSPLADDIYAIGAIADVTRASESGRLGMVRNYVEANARRLLPALPAYAIDAPVIAGTASSGSSEETAPITKIVAGITSAAKANQALHRAGLLEQKTRLSSAGEEKRYWCVTELGLEYGKNVTHPSRPLETQPHWYVSKADEIVQIISQSKLI